MPARRCTCLLAGSTRWTSCEHEQESKCHYVTASELLRVCARALLGRTLDLLMCLHVPELASGKLRPCFDQLCSCANR